MKRLLLFVCTVGVLLSCREKEDKRHTSALFAAEDTTSETEAPVVGQYEPQEEDSLVRPARRGYRRRHSLPEIQNEDRGVISPYDRFFRRYAPTSGLDWTLLAAIAWQESGFDLRAESYAGAKGIMQLMPATARAKGVIGEEIWDAEQNIRAAASFLGDLGRHFLDVDRPLDRIRLCLGAYNCGPGHIEDARRLAGSDSWDKIADALRALQRPDTYRLPQVRYGYVDGEQTTQYVEHIMLRWALYMGTDHAATRPIPSPVPRRRQPLYVPEEMR